MIIFFLISNKLFNWSQDFAWFVLQVLIETKAYSQRGKCNVIDQCRAEISQLSWGQSAVLLIDVTCNQEICNQFKLSHNEVLNNILFLLAREGKSEKNKPWLSALRWFYDFIWIYKTFLGVNYLVLNIGKIGTTHGVEYLFRVHLYWKLLWQYYLTPGTRIWRWQSHNLS